MVIDTSAILAVLLDEPEAELFVVLIAAAEERLVSAASLLEASIALEARKGEAAGRELDLFLYRSGARVVAVDEGQAEIAREAWRRYGKGRHPAALNYGDCFSYALAKQTGEALLFKGFDFSQTDIGSAA